MYTNYNVRFTDSLTSYVESLRTANIDAKVKASVMFDGTQTHNCQLVIQMRGRATDRLSGQNNAT